MVIPCAARFLLLLTAALLAGGGKASVSVVSDGEEKVATPTKDQRDAEPMITESEALAIARKAIRGKVEPEKGAPVTAELRGDRYIVLFGHIRSSPNERGPDYAAKVTIDARNGDVLEVLAGS